MVDIQIQNENEVRLRVWEISGTSNATVTLMNSEALELLVTIIHF
jgi:hypothetical protein